MEHLKRDRLVVWRKKAKLSQTAAAAKLGCHRSAIAKLERGEIALDDSWLRRLSTLYGCQPWELLEDAPILTEAEREFIGVVESLAPEARQALIQAAQQMAKKPRG